jgi:osmoprotectant transport system permease protein
VKAIRLIGAVAALVAVVGAITLLWPRGRPLRVGAKAFTESIVLKEIARQLLRDAGHPTQDVEPLGGTRVLWQALVDGKIDAYPEYTGTITEEILRGGASRDLAAVRAALAERGIGMTEPLGFNNTYALGMLDDRAAALRISTLSDLRQYPEISVGVSNEFLSRPDCWPAVRQRYALGHERVTGLDHEVAYRALAAGTIDVTDLYSTDAEIAYYKLRVLVDDLHVFPEYQAVFLYRLDLADRSPGVIESLERLGGAIGEKQMIAMNARAKLDRVPERDVAAGFVTSLGGAGSALPASETRLQELRRRTFEHLDLVCRSLALAIIAGVPLGLFAAQSRVGGQVTIAVVAAIYTIPSLALLVFMLQFFDIGKTPAMVALFLYSLLPIVRNTQTGLLGIPAPLRESATALGLSRWSRLIKVDLPLAGPSILAGIKTAAVINVGTATIGALIGAGGYGQSILTGIRLDDKTLYITYGALPAAVMALAIQSAFEIIEWWWLRRVR